MFAPTLPIDLYQITDQNVNCFWWPYKHTMFAVWVRG